MALTAVSSSRAWLGRWRPILPLLVAEAVIWSGFGALLPVLPIYFRAHGVDLATLGLVVAAWPAARIAADPVFGSIADRVPRTVLMVAGLLLAAAFTALQLFVAGPLAFIALRALTGMSAGMYEPAARGWLVDANPRERHGEVFGLFGAAQMTGLLLGPAIGGIAASATGEAGIVFWLAAAGLATAAAVVAWQVRERRRGAGDYGDTTGRPASVLNRLLLAAIVLNLGSFFAAGTYDVIWSVWLTGRGGSIQFVGLTFALFAVPVLLLSTFFGRLVDRRGALPFLVAGSLGFAVCAGTYPFVPDPILVVPLVLVEGTSFAMVAPSFFSLVARASPAGRSSTAQGIAGAAGTVGTIAASIATGLAAGIDLDLPFFVASAVAATSVAVGLLIGGRPLLAAMSASPSGEPAAGIDDATRRPDPPPGLVRG